MCTQNDGLVLLELTPLQYRKLSALREAAAQLRPGMDGLARERSVNSVKDVAGQLGPIGAAIDARISDTSDEGRAGLLKEQKALALDLYGRLQVGWHEGAYDEGRVYQKVLMSVEGMLLVSWQLPDEFVDIARTWVHGTCCKVHVYVRTCVT